MALVLAIALVAFAGAWNHDLWIYDEPREAELARAAFRSGNFVYPVLDERPFLEKPPLFTDAVALAFKALGRPSVTLARVVAALFALGTVAVTGWFAAREWGERTGWLAALVLVTTSRFYVIAHQIVLDDALAFFTTAALATGWIAARERRPALAALAGLATAGAFLTKGLVGPGIVGVVLAFDLASGGARARLRTLSCAVPFALVPVALYAIALHRAGGWPFVEEMFVTNQVGRFVSGYATKPTPAWFYASTWLETFLPWSPLAALALVLAPRADATRFVRTWAVVPLVLLTLSQARARPYALPVVPAWAILVAVFWKSRRSPAWARSLALGALVLAALAATGFLAWLALFRREHVDGLAFAGAILSVGCAATAIARPRADRALLAGLAAVALWTQVSGSFTVALVERQRGFKSIADELWARAGARRVVLFHHNDSYSGTFAFYADRSVLELDEWTDPHGEKLLAQLGPDDLAFAPTGALELVDPARRSELVPEWVVAHEKKGERRPFVLLRRRRPEEPREDPVARIAAARIEVTQR